MRDINVGIVGLGNVGSGAVTILAENADEISARLGFRLNLAAVCSRSALRKPMTAGMARAFVTEHWREVVSRPEIDIVAELVGGTGVARQIVEGAIANGKSVVTANKELIALDGVNIWRRAAERGVSLAMEASVCSGIPIHAVLREGICADRIEALFGILNGTSNYILTEIEKHGTPFNIVLADAQKLGYAEADPAADIDGFDARSKLALLASFAFGVRLDPSQIAVEGIRRIVPVDFRYAHQLGCTIRLLGSARREDDGLFVSVRPALVPQSTVLASVQGAYNGIWSRGAYGADTFYYGQGAGSLSTGVAVVSDLMRLARDLQTGNLPRVSPFGYAEVPDAKPRDIGEQRREWFLRFRVVDRPGIIASLSAILAEHGISIDAVLQLPEEDWRSLPFVITTEQTRESNLRAALSRMSEFDFMSEPPLALAIERGV